MPGLNELAVRKFVDSVLDDLQRTPLEEITDLIDTGTTALTKLREAILGVPGVRGAASMRDAELAAGIYGVICEIDEDEKDAILTVSLVLMVRQMMSNSE